MSKKDAIDRPSRPWRKSLLGKSISIFLAGVIVAYGAGALVGWEMFTSSAQEQWRVQARMNAQIATATLRNIYTYIAVETDRTGQVNRIVTDRPIGDDESVLFTGFTPGDVLALVSAQTNHDTWLFHRDAATGAFTVVASTLDGATDEAPDQSQPMLTEIGSGSQFSTGFTQIYGDNYYVALLPIVTRSGEVLGAVATSIGRRADLVHAQNMLMRNSLIVLLAVLALTSIIVTAVVNRLFKPVPELIKAILRIAKEDTSLAVPFQHRSDEIGDLAIAMESLREAVVERGKLRDIRDMTVELAHMAHHDPLTGLPNRALLMKSLHEAVSELSNGSRFNVLMLDLDRFKAINDTMGHGSGDTLLIQTAGRLVAVLKPGDIVARLGGDEFAVIQRVVDDAAEDALDLATRILATVSSGFIVEGQELLVGTSIGIACAPMHGTEASQLLKNADLALYRGKASGRGMFSFYEQGMDMMVQDQHALELDLRLALQRDEFELHYQPIVALATNEICGFEALVRWRHPRYGMVAPDRFIPLAEETGIIVPLGEWILQRASAEAALWPDHLTLAVNLSPNQLAHSGLVDAVMRALEAANLPVGRLELEVTETVILSGEKSSQALAKLSELGIAIVLDDFGTGYASLSNLIDLPFSKIKIDRGFVAKLPHDNNCRAIVAAITGLARGMNVSVTAEGVETEAQLMVLKAAGCTNVQGYLFSRPKPPAELVFTLNRSADPTDVPRLTQDVRPRAGRRGT